MLPLGLILLFQYAPGDEDAFGVAESPGGISPAGEQSTHLPVVEQRENQTGEKTVSPQGVFAAPGERRDPAEVFVSLP